MRTSMCFIILSVAFGSADSKAQSTAEQGFSTLKSLEGNWTGEGPNGLVLEVTYELVSGGEAVVETRRPLGEPSMVTVFHLDNESLMMTHYCSVGNQPRMQAGSISDSGMDFSIIDVTGLSTDGEGHMHALSFEFIGPDVIKQRWTWTEEGEAFPSDFELKRAD